MDHEPCELEQYFSGHLELGFQMRRKNPDFPTHHAYFQELLEYEHVAILVSETQQYTNMPYY